MTVFKNIFENPVERVLKSPVPGEEDNGSSSPEAGPGYLYVWGSNADFRTGLSTSSGSQLVAIKNNEFNDWVKVELGSNNGTALRQNGTLWSWGSNANGRTGQGTTSGSTESPTQIGTDEDWKDFSQGQAHGMAIKEDGTLWAWGSNSFGRTGQGTTSGSTNSPSQVGTDDDWASVSCGGSHSVAIKEDGTIWGCGNGNNTKFGTVTGSVTTMTQTADNSDGWMSVSCSAVSTTAIKDGKLFTGGSNTSGITGQGTTSGDTVFPTQVGTDTDWLQVPSCTIGDAVICLKEDLTAFGFGRNLQSNLGLGDTDQRNSPTKIGEDTDWIGNTTFNAASNSRASLLLKQDRTLWFAGGNENGCNGLGLDNSETTDFFTLAHDGRSNWQSVFGGQNCVAAINPDDF